MVYKLRLLDKYSDTHEREFPHDQIRIFAFGNKTARLELAIWTDSIDDLSGLHTPRTSNCIPGPHVFNLLLLRNPTFIFFCMTMGYFRSFKEETVLSMKMESFLKRNEKYLKERKQELGYG